MFASLLEREERSITSIPGGPMWSDPQRFVGTPECRALATVAAYACIKLKADTISTLPLDFYRERGGKQEKIASPSWYEDPAPRMDRPTWLGQAVASLDLSNNAHLLVERNQLEQPIGGMWLPPHNVRTRIGESQLYDLTGKPWPMARLYSTAAMQLAGAQAGMSPAEQFVTFFKMGMSAEEFGAQWFEEGAHASAILTSELPLTKEQAEEAANGLNARLRRNRRALVFGKGWTYNQQQPSSADAGFIEAQKWVVDQSARIWGIPASLIGGSEGSGLTYNTVEGAALRFVTLSLRPTLVRLETLLSRALLPRGQWCQFNVDALVRASLLDRYNAHQIAITAGFKTPDEVRQLEDMAPLPDGAGANVRPVLANARPGGGTS